MTVHEEAVPGRLELHVGDPDLSPIPGLPDGHLRVLWPSFDGQVSRTPEFSRWAAGGGVLAFLLVAFLLMQAPPALPRREA